MFVNFFLNFTWFPWINFYSETIFLQLAIFIFFYFFLNSGNLYYAAINLFLIILSLGAMLAYYNLEVLTGFLLVTEFTAFFIIIVFLLSLNFNSLNKNISFLVSLCCFFSFFLFCFFLIDEFRVDSISFLNGIYCWDDYYEILQNNIMNDIFGLYLSYYYINGVLFVLFVLLIFIASLICILLVKSSKLALYDAVCTFGYVLDFFRDLVSFDFLRKQNMFHQNRRKPITRLVKFKKLDVAEA